METSKMIERAEAMGLTVESMRNGRLLQIDLHGLGERTNEIKAALAADGWGIMPTLASYRPQTQPAPLSLKDRYDAASDEEQARMDARFVEAGGFVSAENEARMHRYGLYPTRGR